MGVLARCGANGQRLTTDVVELGGLINEVGESRVQALGSIRAEEGFEETLSPSWLASVELGRWLEAVIYPGVKEPDVSKHLRLIVLSPSSLHWFTQALLSCRNLLLNSTFCLSFSLGYRLRELPLTLCSLGGNLLYIKGNLGYLHILQRELAYNATLKGY